MLLVEVEIDALIVYLLLQYFVVLVLDEFGQGLLIVHLWAVLLWRRGHGEFKVVVKVAKAIDHGAQLLVLLLQDLNFIRQAMNLVDELFGVLDLPLLLFEQQLEHCLVILIRLLAAIGSARNLESRLVGVLHLDGGALLLLGIVEECVR